MRTAGKVFTGFGIVALMTFAAWFFIRFYFVFGSGVKAGELNLFVYKGYVFKTYEGRLIQAGYNSKNSNATIQSNEFNFSVTDKAVAEKLQQCAGKMVELHYKEYLGALPWRGMRKYVVDSVLTVYDHSEPLMIPAELF